MNTGTRLPTTEPAFHTDDLEHEAGYRSMSALAIVSLLFGLASPLCFAAPLLLVIPVIGTILSIIAIRRIDASEGTLAGRGAATTALVLCIFFAVASVSRDLVTRQIRTRHAAEFGRDWISLLTAGDTERAFQLTVEATRPTPPPEPGMPPPKETPYEAFASRPFVEALAAAGPDSEIRLAETLDYQPQPRRQHFVRQRFVVTPNAAVADSDSRPLELTLTLQRSRLAGERELRWLVTAYEDPLTTEWQ